MFLAFNSMPADPISIDMTNPQQPLTHESKVPTTKKPTVVPPIVPQIPSIPACDLLSQQGGTGWIEEIIEPGPEYELEDLQPSQRPIICPSEQAQPRRSERIRPQHKKTLPSRLVTRSQTRKDSETYSSILAYEVIEDQQLEPSETFPSQEKQDSDPEYFTISACVEPTGENNTENVFSTQDLVIPTNIDEALQSPIWKKSMDNEYEALIEKKSLGGSIATS